MCICYARHIRIQGIPEIACFPHNPADHYVCIQINTNDRAVKRNDDENKFFVMSKKKQAKKKRRKHFY